MLPERVAAVKPFAAAVLTGLAVFALALAPLEALAETRKLVDIAIDPLQASVIPGRTQAFHATGIFSDDTTEDLTNAVNWSTRDASVATIDANGLATAVASAKRCSACVPNGSGVGAGGDPVEAAPCGGTGTGPLGSATGGEPTICPLGSA